MDETARQAITAKIRETEAAQDSRAQVLGYNLIRHKDKIVDAFRWAVRYPGDLPTDPAEIKLLQEMCAHIRHEVWRHASATAYHGREIEKMQATLRADQESD